MDYLPDCSACCSASAISSAILAMPNGKQVVN